MVRFSFQKDFNVLLHINFEGHRNVFLVAFLKLWVPFIRLLSTAE